MNGGAGYISSHALDELRSLTGRDLQLVEGDLLDAALLTASLRDYAPDAVVHFAGVQAIGASSAEPLLNYCNNACGSVNLLDAMNTTGCLRIVFSSSATIYS